MTRARRLQRLWAGAVSAPLVSPLGVFRLLFLWPLALMLRCAAALRTALSGRSRPLATPVISIGSLMVGGAGKTPFVRWLAG
ncbi:MAG TPA: tetraacyldisaccharide 4'-kinase, partial [candidate division Zixibacteria bacterium]|nr:tetraacyldisaccharide 4'-kinase [candidate division Zixibacteria bacterium]